MLYRAVGNRCAVHIPSLNLPISAEEALLILKRLGFFLHNIDVSSLALEHVGKSKYRLGALAEEAPKTFDCSSFTKYLYAQKGIWIPRLSIQQRQFGEVVSKSSDDLVFTTGIYNYYDTDPNDTVGHVGIVTSKNTIVHAAYKNVGVIESSFAEFVGENPRGCRRILTQEVVTLESYQYHIETSDDIRWLVLKNLN